MYYKQKIKETKSGQFVVLLINLNYKPILSEKSLSSHFSYPRWCRPLLSS